MQTNDQTGVGLGTATWRAVRRRCPSCGRKGISKHAAHVDVRCPHCGFDLEHHPGAFIGGIGVNTVLAFVCLLLVIVVGFVLTKGEPSVGRILLPALGVSVLVPTLLHARSRLTWAAWELVLFPPQPPPQAAPHRQTHSAGSSPASEQDQADEPGPNAE